VVVWLTVIGLAVVWLTVIGLRVGWLTVIGLRVGWLTVVGLAAKQLAVHFGNNGRWWRPRSRVRTIQADR